MATSLAFVACIENNRIASEALLLFESVREFAGRYSQSPIYSFNPRGLGPLDTSHYERLRSLAVSHSDEVLNSAHRDYALANKIYAAAHAEEVAKEDLLVLLDSDSVFLNEPESFELRQDAVAATTPVWAVGIGSRGPQDPAHSLWEAIRQTCRIVGSEPPLVHTRLTREPVSFYCNSGLVVVRRSAGIFSRWRECFERLSASSLVRGMLTCGGSDESGYGPDFFLEQASLTAALSPLARNVTLLDHRYNCPLHNLALLQRAYPGEVFDLDSVIHFHYNRTLHRVGFLDSLNLGPKDSRQHEWLARRLPLWPVLAPADGTDFISAFDERMRDWRESLRQARGK
jgi:hypothetical protein